jgi:predicted GIY-YIG superfamily endonuclease
MTEFVIYSISTNGDVFYIGRTSNFKRRKSEHLHEKKKTYKGNKINKLKTLGLPIEFNILHKKEKRLYILHQLKLYQIKNTTILHKNIQLFHLV